ESCRGGQGFGLFGDDRFLARLRCQEKIKKLADSRSKMKKFDLDSELKGLRVPEHDSDFWDAFPQRVLAELRVPPAFAPVRNPSVPWLAWGFGAALACLVAGFCL